MLVNVQIARGMHSQVKESVAGKEGEHVVKKTDTCVDINTTAAIDIQFERNLGLFGFSFNSCLSHKVSIVEFTQDGVQFVEQDTFLFFLLVTQRTRKYLVLRFATSLLPKS